MSVENTIRQTPFKVEIKPFVEGADPYKENKYHPNGSVNYKAILVERMYLYDGDVHTVKKGVKDLQVRSFMDIRTHFTADGLEKGQSDGYPVVHWGLRDVSSSEDIGGYSDHSFWPDPIGIYRSTKIFELLPELSDTQDNYMDGNVAVGIAAMQAFYPWQLEGEEKREIDESKIKVAEIIGGDKLRKILQMIPPHLEEMMQLMDDKGVIFVTTRELQRELEQGRLKPSEFYLGFINKERAHIDAIATGLEETGGQW